jgi:uncharacterized protein YjeT (DUF2065 family)
VRSIFLHEDLVTMKSLLCLLGMVLIVEGIPYFAFPDKMKKWMALIQETNDRQLRVMGLAAMGIGLIVVYLFKA